MLDGLKSHPDRLLLDHLQGTAKRAVEKAKTVYWEPFGISEKEAQKLVELCALSHDFAKATKEFQGYILNPKEGRTTHAPLSSLVTYDLLRKSGFDVKLASFGYFTVRHHHENLKDFEFTEENIVQLEKQFQSISKSFLQWFESTTNASLPKPEDISKLHDAVAKDIAKLTFGNDFTLKDYILLHTLMSILTSSDHEDAALKDLNAEINSKLTTDLVKDYIGKISRDNRLYSLRQQFHQEIDHSINKVTGRILSVTAPTGLGKTLANIKIALSKASKNSIIVYALPFINIIDQTVELLDRILEGTDYDASTVLPYHHLADYKYKRKDYEQTSIQRVLVENWQSQIVVTTFVSLFESLFTNSRVPFFYKLLNAVIVLDEVQSIPHKYWEPISQILNELSQFGATIILSTATQPMLLKNATNMVKSDYSTQLNRTKILFHGEKRYSEFFGIVEEMAKETLRNKKRLLVIVNTIRESKELFKYLAEKVSGGKLFYLSSNVIPKHRMERIRKLKQIKGEPVVCVSTQVIEAGIDISFDTVIRDVAPLDSVIQASGRSNRTFENELGEVHVYKVMEEENNRSLASRVYDSFLLNVTDETVGGGTIYEERDFQFLVSRYFQLIGTRGNTDQEDLISLIKPLKFGEIGARFHLIEQKYQTVPVYVEYDEEAVRLRGELNDVIKNSNLEKFERLAKIKKLVRQMSLYTINVPLQEQDLNGPLIIENGFVVVTKDNLNYWYNESTGFERSTATMII
ncbi:MAG: CRISPR-associated helicase Cas3' [Pseudothermotoga sp.]